MSTGLMSCVRENSPPLEMAATAEPMGATSLSPSVSSSEQTKRRRFHPLRNLRRIFRRRTLTSPIGSNGNNDTSSNATQSNTTTPTHNSSSILLERTIPNLTLSSPSSPANSTTISPYILMKSPTVPNYSTSQQQQYMQEHQQQKQTVPALSSSPKLIISSTTTTVHQQQNQQQQQSLSGSSRNNIGMSERSPCGGVKLLPTSGFPLNFSPSSDIFHHHKLQQKQLQQQQQSPTSSINLSISPRKCDNKIIMSKSSTPLDSNRNNGSNISNSSNHNNNNNNSNKKESMEDLDASVVNEINCEMNDNQRSFSEGRLIDSDFTRDPLSQSHDSIFSESATASSLSIVLKNELFDVLRKRRNRPDTSDEDLGLPRSPATPQRKDLTTTITTSSTANSSTNAQNQSEISSLSLLSAGSSDIDDEISSNYGDSISIDRTASSTLSSSVKILQTSSFETSKTTFDDLDLSVTDGNAIGTGRLSHSAAKHKMAIRPKKNKGPTRHRRIEPTLLPSTPEVNEDSLRNLISQDIKELSNKEKSRSLPHGISPNLMNQQGDSPTNSNSTCGKESNIKRSKTEKGIPQSNSNYFRNITKTGTSEKDNNTSKPQNETGFFKRFLHRGSKDELDDNHYGKSNLIQGLQREDINLEYSKQVEQTRNEIRREIMNEANTGLSLMLNNFILSKSETSNNKMNAEKPIPSPSKPIISANKPKSGPAARQRIMPKDITTSPNSSFKSSSEILEQHYNNSNQQQQYEDEQKVNLKQRFSDSSDGSRGSMDMLKLSNISLSTSPDYKYNSRGSQMNSSNEEIFNSETYIRDISENSKTQTEHFEKHHHITQSKSVNLYQQKLHRSENLLDTLLEVPTKQRKSVEKSKSFRLYNGNSNNFEINSSLQKADNMPSLPDLTFSRKSFEDLEHAEEASLSLGFEINDNNLINKNSRSCTSQEDTFPLRQGIFTKNIILTTVNPKQSKNISEIEESIDKLLVKSPPQLIMRKSASASESINSNTQAQNVIVTHMYRKNSPERHQTSSEFKVPSASISIRSEASKPIRISNQLSANNLSAKENRKSLIEISKYNDVEPLVKSNSSVMSKSLDSKSGTESMLGTTKIQLLKGSQQNLKPDKHFGTKDTTTSLSHSINVRKTFENKLSEPEKEKRKSVDLGEIKKVFTPKVESSERLTPILRQNSKEDDAKQVDRDSKNNITKSNRSQSISEKTAEDRSVPEFMKIQLNKVAEPCRPKTNIVLSKIIKQPAENEGRKLSPSPPETPTVELRQTSYDKNSSETKPPLPPLVTELEKKRNSYVSNIQETTTSTSSKSNVLATSRIRKSFEEEEVVVLRNHYSTEKSQISSVSPKYERRKSVNDEKLKYEKKIEEMQKSERHASVELRKSSIHDDYTINNNNSSNNNNNNNINSNNITLSPSSTAIPAAVLMRKKSLSLGNQVEKNKDDSTPELMKVFARRSLKIKDEDIQAFIDETATQETKSRLIKTTFSNNNNNCNIGSGVSGGGNLDSDKENQSSSEEKLNKLTKIEQHQQLNQNNNNQKLVTSNIYGQKTNQRENNEKSQKTLNSINNCQNNNNNNSSSNNHNINSGSTGFNIFNSNNNNNNNNSNNNNHNNNNNNLHSTPTKAFNRFSSNIHNNNNNNNNNINNNNSTNSNSNNINNLINSNSRNSLSTMIPSSNNNNNNKIGITLRTSNISSMTTAATPSTGSINNNLNNNNDSNSNNNNSNNNSNYHNSGVLNPLYNKKSNVRHTIGPTITTTANTTNLIHNSHNIESTKQTNSINIPPITVTQGGMPADEVEFKGILQRRAEWEKRVKEAAK
ncbi:uncharacterized protein DDB_G0283357-like isoform X2 [Condylostylus longicornis]|uniref:uncharacterized protein DDB_G0283357-like isoform X2 n=1 Tax=Condylostylus longicornis TaxID=2530218 RepID=UPI00244DB03B|nr:uncharacterized protein DDB_G0283357-like isoform X2 [Condylostylus longicornis]